MRSSSATSDRARSRKSTTSHAAAADATTAGAIAKGPTNNVTPNLPPAFGPLTDPIYEYPRTLGQSVTGGFVYRGTALGPSYVGRYFFADYVAGRVWSFALSIAGSGEATASGLIEHTAELGGGGVLGNISSFGVDSPGRAVRAELFCRDGAAPPQPVQSAASPDRAQDHSMIDATLRRELARAVGPGGLLSDPTDLLTYESDALAHLRAVPGAVVLPASAAEVQAVVRLCHQIARAVRGSRPWHRTLGRGAAASRRRADRALALESRARHRYAEPAGSPSNPA